MKDRATELLFTTEEVLKISGKFGIDTMSIAREIYYASIAEYMSRKDEADPLWVMARSFQNVFEAGRLQGIRQERARRQQSRSGSQRTAETAS